MSLGLPAIGSLIPEGETAFRDAIHIAIAPVTAAETLNPGEPVSFVLGEAVYDPSAKAIGVVDPFLEKQILPGQRFYIFIYPNTVTSLRHAWTHPAFSTTPLSQKETSSP